MIRGLLALALALVAIAAVGESSDVNSDLTVTGRRVLCGQQGPGGWQKVVVPFGKCQKEAMTSRAPGGNGDGRGIMALSARLSPGCRPVSTECPLCHQVAPGQDPKRALPQRVP